MLTIENIEKISGWPFSSSVGDVIVTEGENHYHIRFAIVGHRLWHELRLNRNPNEDGTYNIRCNLWNDKISKSELLSPTTLAHVINTIAEMMPNI